MSGLFSSDTPTPMAAKPTSVPAAPDRSSAEVAALAAKQRQKFSAPASFTKNYFSGGLGGSDVSTATRVLGGVA